MTVGKSTDAEPRALATGDSGVLGVLDVPEYEPAAAPHTLDTVDKGTWEDQNRFLRSYAISRTKSTSARAACIGRSTVYWWEHKDHLDFKSRLAEADEAY